jgi:hypothetical protein
MKIGVGGVTSQDVGLLFHVIDRDKGGTVSYQELRDGLREKKNPHGLRYEGFQYACEMLGLFTVLGGGDGAVRPKLCFGKDGKDRASKTEQQFSDDRLTKNCTKLFEHVSIPEKRRKRRNSNDSSATIRVVDYATMVKAVAHLRLVRHKIERDQRKNKGLEKYKYMDAMDAPLPGKASISQPKPPPRPPERKKKKKKKQGATKSTAREQLLQFSTLNGPNGPTQKTAIKGFGSTKVISETLSSNNGLTSPLGNLANNQSEALQLEQQRDEHFQRIVIMYPMEIQQQLVDMAQIFPFEIKSIKDKDWTALLALNEKQQNRVLDRMYTRLCGPDCAPELLERIKADKVRRHAAGRHRGCVSCKAKIQHAIGHDMYMGTVNNSFKTKKKEEVEFDHTIVPDWLSGHGGDYNFDDWTVSTLLDSSEKKQDGKEEDMAWGFSQNVEGLDTKVERSQTARARFKPITSPTKSQARVRIATAPSLSASSRRSPRQKRMATGGKSFSSKSIDVAVPSYFKEQTTRKRIIRQGLAQNSQLSMVKAVYNAVEDDPHDDDYVKSLARERSSYDRYTLPRTDLGNKLARLNSYRNVPMRYN